MRLASARDTLLRVRAATFDNLFEAISVFASDGRLYLWNRRFSEVWELDENWLAEHPRVDELVPAMARAAGQSRPPPPRSASWFAQTTSGGSRARAGCR